MTKRALVVVIGVATLAGVLAVFSRSANSAPPVTYSVSNGGTAVGASAAQRAVLARANAHGLKHMGNQGRWAFYRIDASSRGDCFGIGTADAPAASLNLVACSSTFPGTDALLDASVVQRDAAGGSQFTSIEGWAADQVATIQAVDAAGTVLRTIDVKGNIYSLDPTETPAGIVQIIALDGNGMTLGSDHL